MVGLDLAARGLAVLLASWVIGSSGALAALAGAVLIATVFAAVYHAEVVAHRTGEPFGTLVLALAVTVIECALIVSVMLAAPADNAGLARDTIFAAVMMCATASSAPACCGAARGIASRRSSCGAPARRWPCSPPSRC